MRRWLLLLPLAGALAIATPASAADAPSWPGSAVGRDAPALWGDLPPGPWAVGFAAHYRYDLSRTWESPGGPADPNAVRQPRPIRILVWYPARPAPGAEPTPFRGYVDLEPTDKRFTAWSRWLVGYDRYTARNLVLGVTGDPEDQEAVLLDAATAAYPDAPPAEGRFPLVLYSLGLNDASQENTVLFEFLASHGYVVATVPQLGPGPIVTTLGLDPGSLELQTRDLEFARGALGELPPADNDRIAAAGFSFGGLVALNLAMRDPSVGAVVSLDGSITHPGGRIIMQSPSMNTRIRTPMLLLHSGPPARGAPGAGAPAGAGRPGDADVRDTTGEPPGGDDEGGGASETGAHGDGDNGHDLELLESLALADRWRLELPGATHGDFTNLPAVASALYPRARPAAGLRSPETARKMHRAVCLYTLALLDATLKESVPAREFLTREPRANGFAGDVISKRVFEPGLGVLTSEELVSIILRRGRERAAAELDRVLESHPEAEPGEPALNLWGYTLLAGRKTAEAIEVFRFNLERHPDSANAHDSLAEAYREAGDRRRAIELYETALEMARTDPGLSEEQRRALVRSASGNLDQLRRKSGE